MWLYHEKLRFKYILYLITNTDFTKYLLTCNYNQLSNKIFMAIVLNILLIIFRLSELWQVKQQLSLLLAVFEHCFVSILLGIYNVPCFCKILVILGVPGKKLM